MSVTPRPSLRDCIGNPHIRREMRLAFLRRCGFAAGAGLAFLLFAASIVIAGKTSASEVPSWVLRGIAAVETGSKWNGDLLHYRDRRVGADGEVGPWQLSPAVLEDMGITHLRSRIHREPVLAESMTRAWLLRCYERAGTWDKAVAIYHTGPRGDLRRGRDYAERVHAAGTTATN